MRLSAIFPAAFVIACAANPNAGPAGNPAATSEPTQPPVVAVATDEPQAQADASAPVAGDTAPAAVDVSSNTGWSTFHGDATRSGATGSTQIKQPKILWHSEVGILSWLNSPLVLGNSVVLVPSSGKAHNKPDPDDGVRALDLASGKRRWFAHFGQDANGIAATADRVFATSDDGNLHALEMKSGKELWKAAGNGKMYTHPLIVGDRVIVGDAGGYVHAFAVQDGKELFNLQLTGAIRGGAAADDKAIYVTSQGGEVAALSSAGKVLWRQIVKRPAWNHQGPDQPLEIYSPPIVDKDALYVSFARDTYYTGEPALYALDKKTGKLKWRGKGKDDWGNVRTTPALVGGQLVYGEPYSGDVVAIDASSGRVTYRTPIGPCYFPQWASPAAAGDLVYLPRFDGSVYAIRARSGKVEWEVYLGDSQHAAPRTWSRPAGKSNNCAWDVANGHAIYAPAAIAENGTLLVGTSEGVLYAIGN